MRSNNDMHIHTGDVQSFDPANSSQNAEVNYVK